MSLTSRKEPSMMASAESASSEINRIYNSPSSLAIDVSVSPEPDIPEAKPPKVPKLFPRSYEATHPLRPAPKMDVLSVTVPAVTSTTSTTTTATSTTTTTTLTGVATMRVGGELTPIESDCSLSFPQVVEQKIKARLARNDEPDIELLPAFELDVSSAESGDEKSTEVFTADFTFVHTQHAPSLILGLKPSLTSDTDDDDHFFTDSDSEIKTIKLTPGVSDARLELPKTLAPSLPKMPPDFSGVGDGGRKKKREKRKKSKSIGPDPLMISGDYSSTYYPRLSVSSASSSSPTAAAKERSLKRQKRRKQRKDRKSKEKKKSKRKSKGTDGSRSSASSVLGVTPTMTFGTAPATHTTGGGSTEISTTTSSVKKLTDSTVFSFTKSGTATSATKTEFEDDQKMLEPGLSISVSSYSVSTAPGTHGPQPSLKPLQSGGSLIQVSTPSGDVAWISEDYFRLANNDCQTSSEFSSSYHTLSLSAASHSAVYSTSSKRLSALLDHA